MASTFELVVKQLQLIRCMAGELFEQERHIEARAVAVDTNNADLVVGFSWRELLHVYETFVETTTMLPTPPETVHWPSFVGALPEEYDSKSSNHTVPA